MLALGIDPGTAICGYGLVEMKGSSLRPVFYGAVLTDKDWKPEDRLKRIHDDVADIIRHFSPDFMSVEKLYFNRNVNTAIPVAQARGVVLLAAAEQRLPIVEYTPMQIKKSGVALAFVPEDRLGMGLVGSMGMTGNMMLRSWRKGASIFLDRKNPEALAQRIWQELEVVTPSTSFPVRRMSGGNVQKVLVGREIAQQPSVLMTAYAVRGLDINTSYTIYNLLTEQKMKGVAVVYVGEDLDVLLELADRILVLCGGKVSGIVPGRGATKRDVGMMMTQLGGNEAHA